MTEAIDESQSGAAHHAPQAGVDLIEAPLGEVLRRSAARFPDRPAIAWSGPGDTLATLTYAEFCAEAERVAFWLLARAQPGDRIAPWSRNSVEWAVLEFGCALAGMVVAAWNPGWSDFECAHARDLTEPALILAGQDTRGVSLLDRAAAIGGADRVVALDDLRRLARHAPPRALPRPEPSDLFLIQFTSGTTGRAKGAALSHRAVVNAAWLRAAASGADETDVWVNPSPLNHMGGAVTMLPGAIVVGGCYVVMERFDAGEYLRLMRLAGATRIGGVPTMLLALLDHPDWRAGTGALRAVGVGGAQVPQPLIERLMEELGAPALVSYAQSECPIVTSGAPGDPAWAKIETVGRCAPHVELKVVDPASGTTVGRGEPGEICVRGPMVMQGYYRAPEASAAAFDADGFLRTGDIGSLDADGYVRIGGRARDVIIRGGENIYPAEVEDALLTHPRVAEAAVIGLPDERWGQQVVAVIRVRGEGDVPPAELEAHAAQRLAHFKIPRRWEVVEAFPLTPNGKIAKAEIEHSLRELDAKRAAKRDGDAL